jgi:hypothetical protein
MKKRILRILLILLVILGLGVGSLFLYYNNPLPKIEESPEANALAIKMLSAIHIDDYKKTRFIEWSFQGGKNTYTWDKSNGQVVVRWNNIKVLLNLVDPYHSIVYKNGATISGAERKELLNKALKNFNNDSFWLVAPFKIFDKGTKRGLVPLEGGKTGLLVTYSQGGDTPGDSYLWELDDNGLPVSFSMWVQILPFKGITASWEGWTQMESGILLPQFHKIGPITLDMGTIKAYN